MYGEDNASGSLYTDTELFQAGAHVKGGRKGAEVMSFMTTLSEEYSLISYRYSTVLLFC